MKLNFISCDVILSRIFRYVLKRYIGQYIVDFSSDVLSYGMSHGKGCIENVQLNVEALNELSEEYNLPLEFLSGSIEFVSIFVPWTSLLSENTLIEVRGLKLVFQPKERPQDVSMFDSMWGSMASSLQLAEECLNEDDEDIDVPDRSEGLQKIAKTIDAALSNLKIIFHDTSLKIEHLIPHKSTGKSLEIKIKMAEYFDEAGVNAQNSSCSKENEKPSYESSTFSVKRVIFEIVSLFTSEFSSEERSFLAFQQAFPPSSLDSKLFVPGSPEMPPTHPSLPVRKSEPNYQREPILISRLSGQQELRLKLKQNEAVTGPKVDVEFNFGAFNLFLTPQQVHLLFDLVNSIIKPNSNCDNSKKVQHTVANKPMRPADYALVEQELLRQQEKCDVTTKSLKNQQGWSSHSLDESDEDFHLMTMENKTYPEAIPSVSIPDDLTSSINSDTRSECNSSYSSTPKGRHRGSTVQAILNDPLSELTRFRGSFSSLLIIILHDDSVQETCTGDTGISSGNLEVQAETFFRDLLTLQMDGFNFKDFSSVREPLSKLCQSNHLRLMASGIVLDGNETSSSAECILKFNISCHQFEVLECLFNTTTPSGDSQNPKYMQLLTFPKNDDCTSDLKEACFRLKYTQVECTSQNRTNKPPANKLDIQFDRMECDVDISIGDRIRTLLDFSSVTDNADSKWDHWKDSDIGMVTQTSSKTEITLSSNSLTINLRFPIPDLRSVHDMERAPWWQQNIHKETLIAQFQEITFKTTLDDDQLFEKYEIQCRDVHGLFQMDDSENPISFLRVSVDPDSDEVSRNSGFDWPRLVIRRMTKIASPDFESGLEETDDFVTCSLSYALMSNLVNEPSPFCSTSVIHDNKMEKETNSNLSSEHDEIIKPSDKENMQVFIEQTVNKSECVFEFTLPTVNIIFPDKECFELLYNRLFNDLLLWENTSLNSSSAYEHSNFKVHVPGLDVNFPKRTNQDQYPVFRPFINDSNSDSDEEETMYMSVHEYYQKQKVKKQKSNSASLTKFSMTFNITKGSLTVNTPSLDENLDIFPGYCGKLQLQVEEASLFLAINYKGDPNESYVCLLADKSALYHEGMAEIETKHSIVEPLNSVLKNDLKCIIYASDPGMHLKAVMNLENSNKEMLKFSIHVVRNPKQQIKTFKIAIEIAGATLHHYVVPSDQMWINQMIQFLNVDNYPVKGYVPPAVVTELHLNLSNCAIDYRPFKLPYRTALTVDNFNMSCNVTASTSFNFRIISEELRLLISNNIEAKRVDLRKNYVCVIDSGLIDISIRRSSDEKDNRKFKMSISNNKIHIRTCADSFKALLELINYLSTNGDMEPNINTEKENENDKSSLKAKTVDSDSENLDMLMAEAMKECSRVLNGSDEKIINSEYEYSNTDDEFCILEDDPGVGLIPKNGCPQVRILTDEPIRIIENHFSVPPGKSDVLKAPKHFPDPLFLLTLQEMSLVWHLYGGNDFKKKTIPKKNGSDTKGENRNKQGVKFSDQEVNNIAVSFCKVTPMAKNYDSGVVQFSMEHVMINENQRSYSSESWLNKGGAGRNHDVLMELHMTKVQFQKEIYPLDSEYASRYILLINDIEVRDRLAISQINKFLYHYTSKDLPRQSHANMIDIKAVYIRPDPKSSTEECSLRVSCKPLRLNVDQDSLMFLVDFFQETFGVSLDENSEGETESHCENTVTTSNLILNSNGNMFQDTTDSSKTFYRYFSFSPDVLIKIDYHGKRVQMEQGAVTGLILGLGQLNASEIRLKRLCYRHGLLGHKKLAAYALNEWQQDILKNQLPSLLGGVGPMYSFVQLFQGVKDLFCLPVIHYRRDGQIIRGLQKGASSFSTSTVVAALDLTSRFFNALQTTAELGFDMVNPLPGSRDKYVRSQELYKKNTQPADIREGVSAALNVMKEGFEDTARTIYRVAATEHEHKGVPGAVGGVLRQIPPSLFRPIILSSEATSYVLDGARHQLMPDAHQEDIHKWKTKNN